MHLKLTQHGRFCKQNNQLPTKNLNELKDNSINVRGEPLFSVMAAGWFCEKPGWIGKEEDVKPVL